jgi:hypothetical protein
MAGTGLGEEEHEPAFFYTSYNHCIFRWLRIFPSLGVPGITSSGSHGSDAHHSDQ